METKQEVYQQIEDWVKSKGGTMKAKSLRLMASTADYDRYYTTYKDANGTIFGVDVRRAKNGWSF